jgi:DNA polymerase III psi subunit
MMLFGYEPADIGLPIMFPAYQVQFHNGARYVWAPPLSELSNNKAAKGQLWQSLKNALSI